MSKGRKSFTIGLVLLVLFVAIAILGPWVAPYSPKEEKPVNVNDNQVITAPEPPTSAHWLGKDQLGRDILTLMLYGLRYTMGITLVVAFFRLAIGGVLGICFGMNQPKMDNKEKNKYISVFGYLSGIPVILVLYSVLYPISFFSSFSPLQLALLQTLLMILLGIAPVLSTVQHQTIELKNRLSVQVSITLVASKGWIIRKHLFPFLKESFIILFFQEMIQVLNLIGQLSLFDLFLGGTDVRGGYDEFFSITFEWIGLIGQNRNYLTTDTWLEIIPLVSYFLLLFSVYLILQGFKKRVETTYQRIRHI